MGPDPQTRAGIFWLKRGGVVREEEWLLRNAEIEVQM
jgi:hypothetical protein